MIVFALQLLLPCNVLHCFAAAPSTLAVVAKLGWKPLNGKNGSICLCFCASLMVPVSFTPVQAEEETEYRSKYVVQKTSGVLCAQLLSQCHFHKCLVFVYT